MMRLYSWRQVSIPLLLAAKSHFNWVSIATLDQAACSAIVETRTHPRDSRVFGHLITI